MSEVLDRIRGALVGLRMPRALEALDHTMPQLEQGHLIWHRGAGCTPERGILHAGDPADRRGIEDCQADADQDAGGQTG